MHDLYLSANTIHCCLSAFSIMHANILHLRDTLFQCSNHFLYCRPLRYNNSCEFRHTIHRSWNTAKNFVLVWGFTSFKYSFWFTIISQNILCLAHSLEGVPIPSEKLFVNFQILQLMFNLSTSTIISLPYLQCVRLKNRSSLPLVGSMHWKTKL